MRSSRLWRECAPPPLPSALGRIAAPATMLMICACMDAHAHGYVPERMHATGSPMPHMAARGVQGVRVKAVAGGTLGRESDASTPPVPRDERIPNVRQWDP